MIIPQGGGKDDKHIKVLAEIDLTVPLPRGVMIKSFGMMRWIEFKYEKCPDFCFCCGMIGPNERNCNSKGSNKDRVALYGNWMKASYPRSPNKKYRTGREFKRAESEEFQGQERSDSSSSGNKPPLTYTYVFHKRAEVRHNGEREAIGEEIWSRGEEIRIEGMGE